MADMLKKMKIVIIVLSVLLGLSLLALAGTIVFTRLNPANNSAVIPDNYIAPTEGAVRSRDASLITPITLKATAPHQNLSLDIPMVALARTIVTSNSAKETVISIYKNHADDSTPFNAPNMFPGDSETKTYLVEVSHRGTVTVRFRADIRPGYEKLAEVMKCRVAVEGVATPLYDGLMIEMPESINYSISSQRGTTTELTYKITVYLDTSVGNEYMNQKLVADFRWWVEESGGDTPPTVSTTQTTTTEEPDDTTTPEETTTSRPSETTTATPTSSQTTSVPTETTAPPETETAGPDVTTREPDVTTREPVETTTEPVETTTEPVETTTEPIVTTTEPIVTTTEPIVTTTEPIVTTTEPIVTTTEPIVTTTEPVETTTEPVETTTQTPTETSGQRPDDGQLIDPPHKTTLRHLFCWLWIIILVAIIFFIIHRMRKMGKFGK